MPELTPEQKKQLDTNIRNMLSQGATEQDVMTYATDFKTKYDQPVKKKVGGEELPIGVSPYGVTQGGFSVNEVSRKPEEQVDLPSTSRLKIQATDARVGGDQDFNNEPVGQAAKSIGKGAALGFGTGLAAIPKAIGVAAREINLFNEYEGKEAKDLATYKAGEWIENVTKDLVGELTPEEQERFSVKLAQGFGQAGTMIVGGLGAKALGASVTLTTAAMGAAQGGVPEWENAVASGATPEQSSKAFWANALWGTTDAWPMVGVFRRLDKYTGGVATGALAKKLASTVGGRLTNEVAQGFIKEAAQEAGQQMLINLTAKETYDATRGLFDDVGESLLLGGIIGSTMTGLTSAIREKRASGTVTPEEDVILAEAEQFAEQKIQEVNEQQKEGIPTKTEEKAQPQEEQKVDVLTKAVNEGKITGTYADLVKQGQGEEVLKDIAQQAQNIGQDGSKILDGNDAIVKKATIDQFGEDVVNAAIEKYPAQQAPKETPAEGEASKTPIKDEYKGRIDNLDETSKQSEVANLGVGDYVNVPKSEKSSGVTGFVKKVGRTNVILDTFYQLGSSNDEGVLQEITVKKADIKEFYKPKSQTEEQKPKRSVATEDAQGTTADKTKKETEVGKPPTETIPPVVPAGESDQHLSGIKKALVADDIVKGVDMERVSDEDMMAMGRQILETGEVKPRELVEKIITEKQGVLKPAEVVALIYYKADLDNKQRETYTEINKRKAAGEDVGTLEVEAKNIEREISDYEVMSVITAQQQSLAFRLRQKLLDQDYNVVTQIEKYKANNDGYIPPEIEEKFNELDRKIKEVKNKMFDIQAMRELKEAQDAVQNIKEEVERELKRKGKVLSEEELDKKVQEGVEKEITKLYEELPSDKKGLADKAIAALEKFRNKLKGGRTYEATLGIPIFLADKGAAVAIRAIKVGKSVAQAVKLGIKAIKAAIKEKKLDVKDWEESFEKELTEFLESEGVSTKPPTDEITVDEDGKLKIPEKKLKDLVASGVTDINELTDKIHEEAVKVKSDATKREVRDAITDYGKKINPTKDAVKIQLNTAKRIGRLLSEVEDLQNKKAKEKNQSTAAKLTTKERELKRQIRALQKQAGINTSRHLTDEEKLSSAKERVKNKIAELETRIRNKDFAKPEKLQPKKDDEFVRLESQKEKLQEEYDNEQYKLELKNRGFWKKTEDVALEATSGLVRGLVASLDLSAGFVQGMYRLFLDVGRSVAQLATLKKPSPNRSLQAFEVMFRSFASQEFADNYLADVKSSDAYPLMKATKLAIDDKAGRVSAKEGLFISNWVNWIWDNVVSRVLGVGNKTATDFFKKVNPYAASQRAFDGYVNAVRVKTFSDIAQSIQKDGYNFESDPKVFEKAADFVNTTTGRGGLGAADASSRWLNIFLFAPRKVISEVKMFTPYAFAYYAKMPKPVRKRALKNLGGFLASFMTANTLLWAALKSLRDDDEEEEDNFWNMDSSDFMTHRIGDKRFSFGGGAKSMLVFQSRLIGKRFTDQYGKDTKLGERYGKQINTKWDLIEEFVSGKASPAIGAFKKKMDERKGLEMDDGEVLKDLTVPIWLQDLKELYKEDPIAVNTILATLGFFGANVRTVDEQKSRSPFTAEDKKDPIFKYFLDKGMELPNVVPASVDVPDKAAKTMKNLTEYPEEKIKQYQEEHKKILKAELKEAKDRGYVYEDDYGNISKTKQKGYDKVSLDQLDKKQLAKILKAAQAEATEKTKQKLFPK